ncbi:MAG TPA: hypothetical protein VE969_09050 [Pyrinomonadaceae bacterium]|nr:hypothetical protein [Pyrinomonadaceae bacterium]
MAWFVAVVLLLFYVLGRYVFHATAAIYLLPLIALLVIVTEFVSARFSRRSGE